jgi:hypothetical protein
MFQSDILASRLERFDSKAINQRRFVYEEALPQRRPGRRFRCTGYGWAVP